MKQAWNLAQIYVYLSKYLSRYCNPDTFALDRRRTFQFLTDESTCSWKCSEKRSLGTQSEKVQNWMDRMGRFNEIDSWSVGILDELLSIAHNNHIDNTSVCDNSLRRPLPKRVMTQNTLHTHYDISDPWPYLLSMFSE